MCYFAQCAFIPLTNARKEALSRAVAEYPLRPHLSSFSAREWSPEFRMMLALAGRLKIQTRLCAFWNKLVWLSYLPGVVKNLPRSAKCAMPPEEANFFLKPGLFVGARPSQPTSTAPPFGSDGSGPPQGLQNKVHCPGSVS